MTSRTWVGSGTNEANDPAAWTPAGAPVAGDSLTMGNGGMNVTGGELAGDTVHMQIGEPNATFNLRGPYAELNFDQGFAGGEFNVNISDGTVWYGGAANGLGTLIVTGPNADWNNSASVFDGSALIDTNVVGTGNITIDQAHSAGATEFQGAVGAGQSVLVTGYEDYGWQHGIEKIDNPSTYQAPTTLGFGEIHLQGLTADSYSYDGSTLTLYDNGNTVDTLALKVAQSKSSPPDPLTVSQLGDGVAIQTDGDHVKLGGTAIPPSTVGQANADEYQYLPPGGTLSDPTPITTQTLAGGPGAYSIHDTGLQFIASQFDEVGFTQGSSFNLTIQGGGGVVEEGGSWNLAIANSGATAMLDNNAANGHNMFVVGAPVQAALVEMQPTDNVYLQGVTQADISAAFQNLAPDPSTGQAVLNLPRAGGSALSLVLPNQASAPLLAAQFHGF